MTDLQQPEGSATRLALSGEVDVLTAAAIRSAASLAIAEGAPELRLDLRDVTFMDSQGVSALVDAHRALARQGARLVLADAPVRVSRLLELTGLDQVIDLAD